MAPYGSGQTLKDHNLISGYATELVELSFLGLDVNISNILQPQNTPWATTGPIGGGGPHIGLYIFVIAICIM